MRTITVIDSHTEGEPTRVVIDGGPALGAGSVAERLAVFRRDFDYIRSAIINEPRGNDAMVGALVCPASNPKAACGVIFFNNVGFLNACGHGTIGLAATLAHLGRIGPGSHLIETPVGEVTVHIDADGSVCLDNVPSYRHTKDVPVTFDWLGERRTVRGDIAWGGNWFYLVSEHGQDLSAGNIETLTAYTWAIRRGLERERITGAGGGVIDHIELFGPARRKDCQSRNFVLCPGKAYDRSPCGTGTSAKLACLYADGKLKPGEVWRQESIIGSVFGAHLRPDGDRIIPTISGNAYITAESTLILDERDPFRNGIRL